MSGLRSFVAPPSLRVLSSDAFYSCKKLKRVELNEGLEVLGTKECKYGVFHGSGVERVRLPSTLRRIEEKAFSECSRLSKIELPEGLEYIGRRCFEYAKMREVTLPSTLKMVEDYDEFCSNFERVYVRDGCVLLGWSPRAQTEIYAVPSPRTPAGCVPFGGPRSPREVVIPDGFSAIGARWFQESGVETVVVPESVREVRDQAFLGCGSLKSVVFPLKTQILRLGRECFRETGLEKVMIPPFVRELGEGVFRGCAGLRRVWFREDG